MTSPSALAAAVDETTFAVAVQSPNVFGLVEDWSVAAETAHAHGALAVGVVNEMFSLALLKPPGESGIDIACGEAASFGIPASFGGPLVGFLACRDGFKRQIPGRLAGRLETPEGPVFALTLSTREQHIRREKATSNICTNQGLFALAATMTLTALGKHGLRETALLCLSKSEYLKAGSKALGNGKFAVAFPGATFNEFALRCGPPVDEVLEPPRGGADPRRRPVRPPRPGNRRERRPPPRRLDRADPPRGPRPVPRRPEGVLRRRP